MGWTIEKAVKKTHYVRLVQAKYEELLKKNQSFKDTHRVTRGNAKFSLIVSDIRKVVEHYRNAKQLL